MSQTRIKIKKNKREREKSRRGAKYWMAVGTMAAYTTFGSDAGFKVYAQQDRPAPKVHSSSQTQGLTVRRLRYSPRDAGRSARRLSEDGAVQRDCAARLDAWYLVPGSGWTLYARRPRCRNF